MAWLAVAVAVAMVFVGLVLLAGPNGVAGGVGRGEVLTALGAIAIAGEIIVISRVAPQLSTARVSIVQLAVAPCARWRPCRWRANTGRRFHGYSC